MLVETKGSLKSETSFRMKLLSFVSNLNVSAFPGESIGGNYIRVPPICHGPVEKIGCFVPQIQKGMI